MIAVKDTKSGTTEADILISSDNPLFKEGCVEKSRFRFSVSSCSCYDVASHVDGLMVNITSLMFKKER